MARVIVVDDDPDIRMLLREILERSGHQIVAEADDGEGVVGLVAEQRPDIVILDIGMPGRDGLTALRHLMLRDPGLNVIMCSASGTQGHVVDALRFGAKDFIPKPFKPSRVRASVERILAEAPSEPKPKPE